MLRIFGLLGVLIALVATGVLVKNQLKTVVPVTAPSAPTGTGQPAPTVRQHSEQVQQQTKQAVEAAMQQARPMPDEAR